MTREQYCCKDIKLLSVAVNPFYLPHEFQQIFITVVYIQPAADTKIVTEKISQTVQKQEALYPDSVHLVLGGFNQCHLIKILPSYCQYATCKTCNAHTTACDKYILHSHLTLNDQSSKTR